MPLNCPNIKELKEKTKQSLALLEQLKEEFSQTGSDKTRQEIIPLQKEIDSNLEKIKESLLQSISETLKEQGNDTVPPIPINPEGFVIGGGIILKTPDIKQLPILTALKEVCGELYAPSATSINLPNLKEIHKYLYALSATSINLPNLKKVNGGLNAYSATSIDLPNLKEVDGDLDAYSATSVNLPSLKKVNGDLYVLSATSIDLQSITLIKDDVFISQKTSPKVVKYIQDLKERGIIKGEIA